ncbi:cortical protein marker for cell polarity-domain-containing protein [Paraphoma chrysanthemicola]|nr:cortical protein marker for cell polarity-domain-containing protein [Paraphoma chrysanthemicola]
MMFILKACLLGILILPTGYTLDFSHNIVPQPNLNPDDLGNIIFTGDFDAALLYKYRSAVLSSTTITSKVDFIRARLPDNTFQDLAELNGTVSQMCTFNSSSGNTAPTEWIAVAGNFTSIDTVSTPGGFALFDPTAKTEKRIVAIPGLPSMVERLLCVEDLNAIFLAGRSLDSSSSKAFIWNPKDGLSILPFAGFNGPIHSITRSSNGSIIFSGAFNRLITNASSVELNGHFEFDPSGSADSLPDLMSQSRMSAAVSLLDPGAIITSVISTEHFVAAAGNFSGPGISNIFIATEQGEIHDLAGSGLNDIVASLHYSQSEEVLFVGGDFTDVANGSIAGLNHVAGYSLQSKSWFPLGSGVNGRVETFNRLSLNLTAGNPEDILIINGNFSQIRSFNQTATVVADGIGVWVPSRAKWLEHLELIDKPKYEGRLKTSTNLSDGNTTNFAGTLSSWVLSATGAIYWVPEQGGADVRLENLGLSIEPGNANSSTEGIVAGLFFKDNELNLTVVGGSFTATASSDTGSAILHGLAIINGTSIERSVGITITGLPGFPVGSYVRCVEAANGLLYIGGIFEHSVRERKVVGLLIFDPFQNAYFDLQPPPLGGRTVQVQTIKARPDSEQIYIGGSFDTAGSIQCPAVCIYDTLKGSWTRPGSNLGGVVTHMVWLGADMLVIAGELTLDGQPLSLAAFNVAANQWTPVNERSPLDGKVTAMVTFIDRSDAGETAREERPDDSFGSAWSSDTSNFWIAGKGNDSAAFLKKWDGNNWTTVQHGYSADSIVHGLEFMSRSEDGAPNDLIDQSQYLLLLGDIGLPQGRAAAVLFDGTTFTPWIFAKTASGQPGSITSVMFENPSILFRNRTDPYGHVLAISITIVAVLISIIVIGEVENAWYQRRRASTGYGISWLVQVREEIAK